MEKEKPKRGGMRIGAGRKKSKYQTKTISFRVRIEHEEMIKKIVWDYVYSQTNNGSGIFVATKKPE